MISNVPVPISSMVESFLHSLLCESTSMSTGILPLRTSLVITI